MSPPGSGSPGPTLTLVAELKKFIELRLAKGMSVIASCSGNILAIENICSKQSIRGTKEEFRARTTNASAFISLLSPVSPCAS